MRMAAMMLRKLKFLIGVGTHTGKVVNVLFKDDDRFSIVLRERTNFQGQWMGLIPLMHDVNHVIFEAKFEKKLDHIFSELGGSRSEPLSGQHLHV